MKRYTKRTGVWSVILALAFTACTYNLNPLPPGPSIPEETTDLEAEFVSTPPNSVNSPFWNTADFIVIRNNELQNIVTGQVNPEDGVLNTNGMIDGLSDFNKGDSSGVNVKAAYDEEFIYILAEWTDQTYNFKQLSWLYNGPEDPNKPGADPTGWTSQGNDDNLILDFNAGGGTRDIWKWSLAISEPLGYALDMFDNGSGETTDEGDWTFERNTTDGNGPAFEWSGETQELQRPLQTGPFTRLDPALYLYNTMAYTGDIVAGELIYQAECAECHGSEGDGFGEDGGFDSFVPMTDPTLNRLDFPAMDASLASNSHSGRTYWTGLTEEEQVDLVARIRGFAGLPGYVLSNPEGNAPDIQAVSGENLARVEIYTRDKRTYKVLLVRALQTGKPDDVQFSPEEATSYDFNLYLTDNDDLNRVGINDLKLIFK